MDDGIPQLVVDRNSPVPLYFQVAQHLEQLIESGAYPPGTRLDNEILLADQLGLSRPTMRRAIEYLVDRGLLVRKRGVGTQVVQPKVRRPVELSSLFDDLRAAGRSPHTQVLAFDVDHPSEMIAETLGIDVDTDVYVIERLRYTGDEPLSIMRNYIPTSLLELSSETLEEKGLYDVIRAAGISLKIATQSIGGRTARTAEARLLDEKPGAPLLTMTRVAYDDAGRAIEYGSHLYRASLYTFELTLTTQ
ncbi:GntR family transcriptional regulator [Actinobacteria bacterium YIM 96077]|uniref:GntR family transcriptional regulator n=1 Tax=Phytoactinopolyspora halophila TaxID=1981511 RepID=A0A329QY48_9ACTN|nr:GntR family transcriptional regulator [Phytoactinopolyspora halophila]AYY13890.1 GntR family transcriptional regulator [Actinobacteria bacterium YIM 96077]RAW15568.1 GntR family transcriptional regulator [Phytoactinopolyspora halophila]